MNDVTRANWSLKYATPAAAVWFVIALTVARLVFLVFFSSYTLAEDEAHYWEWAKHPAWSYYSKGPGVAWVIAASTAVFGDVEWAVRLPAVLAGAIGSLAAAWCAGLVFADRRAVFFGAVLFACVPPFQLTSLLMTIDGPYIACWMVACGCALKARATGRGRWMVCLGLALAVGFLFKYTIVLLAIGLVPGLMMGRSGKRIGAGAWIGFVGAFLLGLVPVTIWNLQHEWVTVRHLLGHLGVAGGDMPATQGVEGWRYSPLWTLEYLAMLLLIGPVGVMGTIGFVRFWKESEAVRLMAQASAPVLGFYLLVTLLAEAEGNWALGGFAGFVVVASGMVPIALDKRLRLVRTVWRLALIALVVSLVGFMNLSLLSRHPRFGEMVPVYRVSGMREHAAAVERELRRLEAETGLEGFVICSHYGRASQLAFYLSEERKAEGANVFASSSMFASGRKSQHDLWRDRDLRNDAVLERLRGRPAVLIGSEALYWRQGFERVEELGYLAGEPKNRRLAFVGYGYRGLADLSGRK